MISNAIEKFTKVNDFQLAYWEKNPSASHTIFFIHGNSGSSSTWVHQFADEIFKDYRLIVIDLPGHGSSSDSDNPSRDYSPLGTGKILAEAVSGIKNDNPFSFVGFSYGTNLIAEMLKWNLKPEGIVLISSCVAGGDAGLDKILIKPEASIYFHDNINRDDAHNFLKERIKSKDSQILLTYLDDYIQTRIPFRSHLIGAAMKGEFSDEIQLLKDYEKEILVIFGLEDNLVNIHYLDTIQLKYWRDTIFKLEGSGHYVQTDIPSYFNGLLMEYLNDVLD